MIKSILVPVSGSDTDNRVFAAALAIARPLAAHIKFFHVRLSASEAAVRTPHVEFCVGPAIHSVLGSLERDEKERAATAIEHVRAFCTREDIAFRDRPSNAATITAEMIEETDLAQVRLLAHARHSDLAVLARPAHEDLMPYHLIETLLLESGRPVLIAPDTYAEQPSGTIVIGWQETAAAARALTAALPLLKAARRVVLVNVGESLDASPQELDRVAAQLSWHGVAAETRFLVGGPRSALHVLLQGVADLNPEIFVLGGYSHPPLHEAIFGGVTRALLAQAETSIFMMH